MSDITEKPGDFIVHGWNKLSGSNSDKRYFATMVTAHFDTMAEGAGAIFRAFYQAAHEKPELQDAFYTAVKRSFEGLKPGSPSAGRRWNDIMTTLVNLSTQDELLHTHMTRYLVGGTRLGHLINHPEAGYHEYQAASDIMTAAGGSDMADDIDKTLVPPIVKWHMGHFQHDFIKAASRLAELRKSPLFVVPVAQIENRAGVHVEYKSLGEAENEALVLCFDRDQHHVSAFSMHTKGHADEVAIDDCDNPHHDQVMEMVGGLLECDLPHQDWVIPIACDTYYGFHKN